MKHRVDVWEAIGKEAKNNEAYKASEDEFISDLLAVINTTYRASFPDLINRDFDGYDIDGDGFISPKEHEAFFYSWGIPTNYSAEAFKALDTDGDGLITRDEYIQGATDFMFSEDENSPYKNFLGPLLE
ncbi:sarcoplasmic calcium-binding protein-like [Lingula anatina]|uniref:Sarcoplasmic calcium-binding protein-like n=1 Tax=Lingula anatina TaxID=7574 RepID=A0A1S3HNP4_LINAN|nr:sarcoplasmic calcium-binding protein-like [Lingula anatina]|eukprot:XP_013386654.1 sarcoplasmic calcium-binding protein-like [Lingula anatina]